MLAQLGNRVQHALRAYTPREQKAVKTAADTFRPNPDFNCATAITQLGTGEALVSPLEAKGVPSMVQRTLIRPPASRLGPITDEERRKVIANSPVAGQYDETVDRESAFEMLQKRASDGADAEESASSQEAEAGSRTRWTLPDFDNPGQTRTTSTRTAPARTTPLCRAAASGLEPPDGGGGRDEIGGALGEHAARPRARARHPRRPEAGKVGSSSHQRRGRRDTGAIVRTQTVA